MKAKNVMMTLGLGAVTLGALGYAGSKMRGMSATQVKDKVLDAANKMMP